MTDTVLEVRAMEVTYNGLAVAIKDLSLSIGRGEIVAMLGPNGAGKTTTIRAIGGVLSSEPASVTRGEILFEGRNIVGRSPHHVCREGISIIPERDKIFGTLSVSENLRVGPTIRGREGRVAREELLALVYEMFPVLEKRGEQRASLLSGGEKQMLALGRALMTRPSVLLCDEPSLGISPLMVDGLMGALSMLSERYGMSVLLAEQNAVAALAIAHRAVILHQGRISVEGTAAELAARDDVRRSYLGIGAD